MDEKFLYAVCVNVTIHSEKEDGDDNLIFLDKMTAQIKEFQANQTDTLIQGKLINIDYSAKGQF